MTAYAKTKDPEIFVRNGVYYYRGTPVSGGVHMTKSLGVKSFGLAMQAKKNFLVDIRGLDPKATSTRFSDCSKLLLKEQSGKTRSTFLRAQAAIKQLDTFFGGYLIQAIDEVLVEEYILEEHRLRPTRKLENDIGHLNTIMLRAFNNGLIRQKRRFRNPDGERKKKRAITPDEITAMLNVAPPAVKLFIQIGYTMGMRPGEILSLEWRDVDLNKRSLTVRADNNKNDRSRTISLSEDAHRALSELAADSPSNSVFVSRYGLEGSLRSIKGSFNKTVKLAGIKDRVTPNYLRHSFQTEAAKKIQSGKIGLVQVVKYVDTSIEVFEKTYLHLTEADTKYVASLVEIPK